MPEDEHELFSSVPSSRRSFIKKMVAVAFVAPVISSFSLDALASTGRGAPKQIQPNQPEPEDHDKDDRKHSHRDDDDFGD